MLNKVPEVTLYFWIIKCLCTTIGETFSDNLTSTWAGGANPSVHALDVASVKVMLITVAVLAVLLAIQFTRKRYVAAVYWANIVVISLVGHADHRPVRGERRPAQQHVGDHDRVGHAARRWCSSSGGWSSGRCRCTRSGRSAARPSTGSRSSSPSPPAPRSAT